MNDYFKNDQWYPEYYKPNTLEMLRWELMKKYILNPLREWLGAPIRITSGLRTEATFDRLVREGYHPSTKSDHFWGNPELNHESTAAVDIIWSIKDSGKTVEQVLRAIKNGEVPGMIEPKQAIWERQVGKDDWMHISLPMWIVFGSILAGMMSDKRRYLIGTNGRYEEC